MSLVTRTVDCWEVRVIAHITLAYSDHWHRWLYSLNGHCLDCWYSWKKRREKDDAIQLVTTSEEAKVDIFLQNCYKNIKKHRSFAVITTTKVKICIYLYGLHLFINDVSFWSVTKRRTVRFNSGPTQLPILYDFIYTMYGTKSSMWRWDSLNQNSTIEHIYWYLLSNNPKSLKENHIR